MTFSATLPPPVRLRALVHPDLADLLAVQRACYGQGFVESVRKSNLAAVDQLGKTWLLQASALH